MSAADPFWKSGIVRGAIIAAIGTLSMGAAAVVRTHGEDIATLKTGAAVQVERDNRIIKDLEAIKLRLGIIP